MKTGAKIKEHKKKVLELSAKYLDAKTQTSKDALKKALIEEIEEINFLKTLGGYFPG